MARLFRTAALVAVAVLAASAVGCGSSGGKKSKSASATGAAAGNATGTTTAATSTTLEPAGDQIIAIQNFKFSPDALAVKAGAKVSVAILDDNVPHSMTADDGSFDTGIFTKSAGPKTITLSSSGTFRYHCQVHTFMKGTIDVT